MAEEMLRELEAAAQIILASPNIISAEQRQSAEAIFLNFRKTRAPYQLCRQILDSNTTDYILFETVGLIKTALVQEWMTLSETDVSSLRQYLLHYVLSKPTLAPYVRARILQVIAIIIKRGSVDDFGQERRHILNEVESLIRNGDLPKKILGCNILSAILEEYATTAKSSELNLTWEVHFREKKQFELSDMKKIFKLCIEILGQLIEKDFDELTLPFLKHLLSIVESILVWAFINENLPKKLMRLFESNESTSHPPLRLHVQWQDIIVDPAVLDIFFGVYWKVRSYPQLAHHAMTCLVQLATLHGRILTTEQVKMQYLTNYIQRFLKLVTSIDVNDQEASGIADIIRKISIIFESSLKNLPEELLKSFMEQMTRLTCLFIEGAAQEDAVRADDCLYMEATNRILGTWICNIFTKHIFPIDFCYNSCSVQIFNVYLRCHLSPPEGMRGVGNKNLSEEVTDMEEDDKVKFKDQLQIIGSFGRRVPSHALNLLTQLLEDRIQKLRDNLNAIVGQSESLSRPPSMDDLYEDLHWLVLIAGHVLCMETKGEISLIPFEITRCSMEQSQTGNVDVNRTLEFLVSSQNVQSDINSPEDASIDRVIRLIADVFRLCAIEKTAVSVHLENILSPELSHTIVWFLHEWSQIYLLPAEGDYCEISTTILQAFGEDSPGALWTMNFLLDKIICNINAFKSEPALVQETIELLKILTESRTKASCLLKCEQYRRIIELATKGLRDFPALIKRGLMQVVVQAGVAVQDTVTEGYYWSQTLEYVEQRCTELMSGDNFTSSHHRDEIRFQVVDILDSFIGMLQGARKLISKIVYRFTYSIAVKLPELLVLYFNYRDIVQLILEVLNVYTKDIILHLPRDCCSNIYDICLEVIQTYVKCYTNRLTTDSTAEEDALQDILLLMQLLNNLLDKDLLINNLLDENMFKVKEERHCNAADIFLHGLDMLMPLMTIDLLKFSSLCYEYFKVIALVCEICPLRVLALPAKQMQQLLASMELGFYSFGNDITAFCCDAINILAFYLHNDARLGVKPKNQMLAPFINLMISLILSNQFDSDVLPKAGRPLYFLIACYRDQYQELVQNIISSQTNQETAQRLANAFTALTADVNFTPGREESYFAPNFIASSEENKEILKFRNNLDNFIVNVQGFLMVK